MARGPHGVFEGLDEVPAERRPVVFMFQPNAFEPVTPDRLAEWERALVDHYGVPRATFDDPDAVLNGGTWSNCGDGRICADDSDNFDVEYAAPSGPDEGTSGRRPAVFMWQPSRFYVVPAERLADWERVLREHVGIPAAGVAVGDNASGTLSATHPNDCMDDSDYLSE